MTTQIKILELRKELRKQYNDLGLKLYLIMLETDEFLERIYNGLNNKQEVSKY